MRSILVLFMLFFYFKMFGQEPTLTNSIYNKLSINPAFTSNEEGSLCISLNHKKDFFNIRGPFNYSSFSMNYGFCNNNSNHKSPNFGMGLMLNQYEQGDGYLKQNNAMLFIGGNKNLKKNWNVSIGISAGYFSQNIDWDKLIFSDQLDPIYGLKPQLSSNYNANFILNRSVKTAIGIKITNWEGNGFSSKYLWNIGASVENLFGESRFSLQGNSQLSKKYIVHGSWMMFNNAKTIDGSINLNGRVDYQDNFLISILNLEYFLNNKFTFGTSCRISKPNNFSNVYSFGPILGYQPREDLKFICSSDFYFGGFNYANNIELGIIWSVNSAICSFESLKETIRDPQKAYSNNCKNFTRFKKNNVIQVIY